MNNFYLSSITSERAQKHIAISRIISDYPLSRNIILFKYLHFVFLRYDETEFYYE